MIKLKHLPVFFLMALLFSCKSVPDDYILFKDLNNGRNLNGTVINPTNDSVFIVQGNVLRIIVSSENILDSKTFEQFNLLPVTPIDPALTRISNDMEFQTFSVDGNGEIEFPKFGKMKVQGLTHFGLEAILQGKLKQYMSNPVVRVNISQNWVKVLGEVAVPGLYPVENRYHYSIIDVFAAAGGITTTGDKKHIKLIREDNGKLESTVLDLTTSDIFTSPYYYVKPNDIVVVDPNATRRKDAQYGSADSFRLSAISSIVGTISGVITIVILATQIRNNSK